MSFLPRFVCFSAVAFGTVAACAKGSGGTSPIPAGLHQHTDSIAYYDVDGRNAAEVYRSMISLAPRSRSSDARFAYGRIQYSHSYRDSYQQSGAVCRASLSIRSQTVIVLPRWKFSTIADANTQRAWSSFTMQVRDHENLHRAIFLKGVDSAYVAATALTAPDCPTLRPLVRAAIAGAFRKAELENAALDNSDRMAGPRWPP
jgi:predicted secreted Zn-dependent protease